MLITKFLPFFMVILLMPVTGLSPILAMAFCSGLRAAAATAGLAAGMDGLADMGEFCPVFSTTLARAGPALKHHAN